MLSHRVAFAAMLFVVSACATATTPEQLEAQEKADAAEVFADDPRRGEEVDRVCFTRNINGFGETTRRAIVIREGNDNYLVETFPGCFDLDWAQAISFDSFGGCLSKGDRVFAFDNAFGGQRTDRMPQFCRVKTIYEWDRDAGKEAAEEADTDETDGEPTDTTETVAR